MQVLPQQPLAPPADPRGQQAEGQAASSACNVTACDGNCKHLAAMTGTALGQSQQPSQQSSEPPQDACSRTEGDAQDAESADRALKRLMPKAAEQGSLLRSAPPSTPLPEPAQEAPAATMGLQDIMAMLMPPELHTTSHIVPSQQLNLPRNAHGAVRIGSVAAGAGRTGTQQQLREPLAHSPQPKLQEPRSQPRAGQAEACTGPPSSCVPAAVPGDELCPDDECVLCLAAHRCVLLAPCGHMPYCIECAEQLCGPKGAHAISTGQACPLCREAVLGTVSKTFY